MENLKAEVVSFLTREESSGMDVTAAKQFASCELELLPVRDNAHEQPIADLLIHGDTETISTLKSNDFAGRIENAIKESSDTPIRHLQWVESQRTEGPKNSAAIGYAHDAEPTGQPKNPGDPPRFDHQGPRPIPKPPSQMKPNAPRNSH